MKTAWANAGLERTRGGPDAGVRARVRAQGLYREGFQSAQVSLVWVKVSKTHTISVNSELQYGHSSVSYKLRGHTWPQAWQRTRSPVSMLEGYEVEI